MTSRKKRLLLPSLILAWMPLAAASPIPNGCPFVTNVAGSWSPAGGCAGGTWTLCFMNTGSEIWGAFDFRLVNPLTTVNTYTAYSGPGSASVTSHEISVTGIHIAPGEILSFDVTQAGTFVASYSELYVFGLSRSYCTAGTSASGCQAALSGNGTPSASATSGFQVQASGVEGDKSGIFFYGTNGRQANSWGNGTSYQCVVPPVIRAGLLTGSGTSGACDGAFQQDMNALWSAIPNKNPGAGANVQLQLWYRDPLNTSNRSTSTSDALEFTVCP